MFRTHYPKLRGTRSPTPPGLLLAGAFLLLLLVLTWLL
jgi:hypothetical protein